MISDVLPINKKKVLVTTTSHDQGHEFLHFGQKHSEVFCAEPNQVVPLYIFIIAKLNRISKNFLDILNRNYWYCYQSRNHR